MRFIIFFFSILIIDARFAPPRNSDGRLRIVDTVDNPVAPNKHAMRIDWEEWTDWDNWGGVDEIGGSPQPGTSVCYPLVGCFDNNPPFDNAGLQVPQNPSVIDTQFLLFTHSTPTSPEFLQYHNNDSSIVNSKYNKSNWLRIIVHGFTNNRNSPWIKRLTEELLTLKDVRAKKLFERFVLLNNVKNSI